MNILVWERLCLAIDSRSKMLNCTFNPAEGLMVQDVYKSKVVNNE